MFVHSDEMEVDPQGRLHTFCHAVRGKWHMMGVTLSAGASLAWLVEQVCKDAGDALQPDPYKVLLAEAERCRQAAWGSFSCRIWPASVRRTPTRCARGCFIGLTQSHHRGHLVRSVLEGVTYSLRDSLEIIKGLKVPVKQIRVSGGGGKSPLWRQIQADVFGQDVITINAEQGPAYGVALLAAVGAGAFKNVQQACEATIRVTSRTTCHQARVPYRIYKNAYPVYRRLYGSLKDDFQAIAELQE